MLSRLFLAAMLVIGLSASLQAQPRGRQPVPQLQFTEKKEVQGSIDAVAPGGMLITDSATTLPLRVIIPPNAKIQVLGKASHEYLRAGQLIEFKANVDEKGAIKDKVEELTVVVDKRIGVFSAEESLESGEMGAAPKKPAKRTGGAIPAGTYSIVSKLAASGGKFSVKVGRSIAELADEPTIKVDLTDYSLAVKGDKVSVKGMKAAGQDLLRAEEVKIELAEPLAGAKKKGPPAKGEAKKPSKRSKKDKDEGLPEQPADK